MPASLSWPAIAGIGYVYAQSKSVAEHVNMVADAAAETAQFVARIFRLGQACGNTEEGIWIPAERVPATVQAARTIEALPVVEREYDDEEESWVRRGCVVNGRSPSGPGVCEHGSELSCAAYRERGTNSLEHLAPRARAMY